MEQFPSREDQILRTHAPIIAQVVRACQNLELRPELERVLQTASENGWTALVASIRKILNGARESALFAELDDEDSVIVRAILLGLQDPSTLPNPTQQADPTLAAPGLAAMISAAAKGDVQALEILGNMAEQMSRVGGDMARIGGIIRRLIDGERDAEALAKGLGPQGESLLLSLLGELGKLQAH